MINALNNQEITLKTRTSEKKERLNPSPFSFGENFLLSFMLILVFNIFLFFCGKWPLSVELSELFCINMFEAIFMAGIIHFRTKFRPRRSYE